MNFNSGTDSIVAEIDSLCDSNSVSYPIEDKTRRVNIAFDEVVSIIFGADGTWQYDDLNQTELPIWNPNLVDGQQKYSFLDEIMIAERVEVKDINGNWSKLKPFDQRDVSGSLEELYPINGLPTHYDKQGNSILLYPKPDVSQVTLEEGLKVWFKRNSIKFIVSDTTKSPGFASLFHPILAYMASIPYCMSYKKDRVALYRAKVFKIMNKMESHYDRRSKDEDRRLTPARGSNK